MGKRGSGGRLRTGTCGARCLWHRTLRRPYDHVIKDLKVKGLFASGQGGTKGKNIRLVEGDHDIDCKIDGVGAMGLKAEFVKKA